MIRLVGGQFDAAAVTNYNVPRVLAEPTTSQSPDTARSGPSQDDRGQTMPAPAPLLATMASCPSCFRYAA